MGVTKIRDFIAEEIFLQTMCEAKIKDQINEEIYCKPWVTLK